MGDSSSPPKPFSENIIETAMFIAKEWGISFFDVMQQDIDDFFMYVNYLINLGENKQEQEPIKKNDGFWDF